MIIPIIGMVRCPCTGEFCTVEHCQKCEGYRGIDYCGGRLHCSGKMPVVEPDQPPLIGELDDVIAGGKLEAERDNPYKDL